MAKRTQEQAEETRRAIIAAARHLFATEGYAATSIAKIVADAGATKGALFHHFASKESLFLEVWNTIQLEMDAETRAAAEAGRSPSDPYAAFLAGTRVYFKWASKEEYQRIALVDGRAVMGLERWQERDDRLGRSNVEGGVRHLARKGLIKERNVVALSIMLLNALNGAGFALTRNDPGITADSLFEAFEELLRGLR
ncbi:TetR/AcrR family transcriptional regulator [Hyphomonas johnsonii]|uniref:TetR family transcriptional regulator n=1 Tax=Hyphomonas johnsonii MHS-2 TaxID=1280950 RepID=A0A059FCI5_9PROT|nr:TetR family transcriptional regulator [Hyphomonas johnsonii]KCZ88334.1 TetR family transcriptional regulator [Hyphomonas johnsonii MHS-2]